MFEPDEYIFTKLAYYFKRRKKRKQERLNHAVNLVDIKSRLNIFSKAITGQSIEIYDAQREGGYKNNNFFLPKTFAEFPTVEENVSFYLFRVLYLSVQKNLNLNWNDEEIEHDTKASQEKAAVSAPQVLDALFEQFPVTREYHQKFIELYKDKAK